MNVVRDDQIDMKSLELVTTSSAEALTTPSSIEVSERGPMWQGLAKKFPSQITPTSAGSGPLGAWALAGLRGRSPTLPEGRLSFWKIDYSPGRLINLPETLNGPCGASNGRFGPCFDRKIAVRATFRPSHGHDRPEIGHLADHSAFRETNDASKSIRDLPERIIDVPGKVTMVSGSINDVSQWIRQVPRRIREVPRVISEAPAKLTMGSGP